MCIDALVNWHSMTEVLDKLKMKDDFNTEAFYSSRDNLTQNQFEKEFEREFRMMPSQKISF